MTGIKQVNDKKFCAQCEEEADIKNNYCPHCGNPLNLNSSIERMEMNLSYIDMFIKDVITLSKENKISIENALKKVREDYKE